MSWLLGGVLLYVVSQLAIGVAVSRRQRTEGDYLLAGRSLGYPLAIFSIFATWFGAETCIGSAGAIYEQGISGGSADPFGYALCLLLAGLVFAAPLRRRGYVTLADLYRERYSPGVERGSFAAAASPVSRRSGWHERGISAQPPGNRIGRLESCHGRPIRID
jgi:Na+/proline symporter